MQAAGGVALACQGDARPSRYYRQRLGQSLAGIMEQL